MISAEDWKGINAELDKPLDGRNVKGRNQAGRTVSYIESWLAIAEANRIFGFGEWSSETVDLKCVAERERKIGNAGKDGWGVSYIAKVRVRVGDVIREGVGAGHGIDVDLGQAHESAIKEAESDSRKRALMTFGNPFGLALYDKTQANVDHDSAPDQSAQRVETPKKSEPAPTTPRNSGTFDKLKERLNLIGHEKALDGWIEEVKAALRTGTISVSEKATLSTLLENKRGFLAQRSAA